MPGSYLVDALDGYSLTQMICLTDVNSACQQSPQPCFATESFFMFPHIFAHHIRRLVTAKHTCVDGHVFVLVEGLVCNKCIT